MLCSVYEKQKNAIKHYGEIKKIQNFVGDKKKHSCDFLEFYKIKILMNF